MRQRVELPYSFSQCVGSPFATRDGNLAVAYAHGCEIRSLEQRN